MNKKIIDSLLVIILMILLGEAIAEDNHNQLGKSTDFPSDSVFSRAIDNYSNVLNYSYITKTSNKSNQKNIHLKDLNFSFLNKINIPGMPATKENDFINQYIFSTSQCPQGICITDDFVFITSYSAEDNCLGEFMVFHRETGEYMITLGMDQDSHLGGIAYDGENVWVCNSKDKTIERISYDFIYLMATQNKGEVIDATKVVDVYPVKNIPSCITYFNGRLWIATHNVWFNSHMVAYYYDKNEDLVKALSTYNIPSQVQGIAFGEQGEVYFSTSYGRKYSSYIKKYKSIFTLIEKVNEPMLTIEMPPCSEEITIYDDVIYVLFESAGEKYLDGTDGGGNSLSPLDKILMIPLENTGD